MTTLSTPHAGSLSARVRAALQSAHVAGRDALDTREVAAACGVPADDRAEMRRFGATLNRLAATGMIARAGRAGAVGRWAFVRDAGPKGGPTRFGQYGGRSRPRGPAGSLDEYRERYGHLLGGPPSGRDAGHLEPEAARLAVGAMVAEWRKLRRRAARP